MSQGEKILVAVGLVLVDVLLFALPLTAFFACYLIFARPLWFRDWVLALYSDKA